MRPLSPARVIGSRIKALAADAAAKLNGESDTGVARIQLFSLLPAAFPLGPFEPCPTLESLLERPSATQPEQDGETLRLLRALTADVRLRIGARSDDAAIRGRAAPALSLRSIAALLDGARPTAGKRSGASLSTLLHALLEGRSPSWPRRITRRSRKTLRTRR